MNSTPDAIESGGADGTIRIPMMVRTPLGTIIFVFLVCSFLSFPLLVLISGHASGLIGYFTGVAGLAPVLTGIAVIVLVVQLMRSLVNRRGEVSITPQLLNAPKLNGIEFTKVSEISETPSQLKLMHESIGVPMEATFKRHDFEAQDWELLTRVLMDRVRHGNPDACIRTVLDPPD